MARHSFEGTRIPNELSASKIVVRDRRESCISKPKFLQLATVKAAELVNIGAPFLPCLPASQRKYNNCFNVERFYILFCQFYESLYLELYAVTYNTIQKCNSYPITPLFFNERDSTADETSFQNIRRALQ